ncbi:MAG: LysR family transcriptional regulator [Roseburia sp.]|nr:LysR family transcriptional regulator [Roseburia sp.]
MNVNFEYYRIFYYVAKYHNFTKTAHALGSSQPNVTRAMNCLEQQINTTLFVRTNRGIQLTPEGEKLYTHISAAMSQIFAAEEELSDSTGLSHGSIAIGVSETALNIFLFDKLKAFHMTYPGIRLKLYNHSTPQAIDAVKSGKIDFAIVSTPASVESPLRQIMLQPFQEILVGGTTFTALGSQELSLAELKNYPLISLGRETTTFQFYHSLFLSHGLELAPDTETATTDQILPLVKCELGLAFLPEAMARDSIQKREIVQISLKENIPERNICMVYDCQHPLNTAARQFRKMILEDHLS